RRGIDMAWVEKRGQRWQGRYRDANGKIRVAASSTSKREAKRMADDKESEVRRGVWHDPSAGRIKFSEYFEDHWLPNRVGESNTIATYRSHYRSTLQPAFGDMEIRRITSPVVQRWVVAMQKEGMKPSTIQAKYKALATILGARKGVSAVRDGLIQRSPCEGIDLPTMDQREVDVYTVEEVDRLMSEIPESWRALPLLAADTGMRWGELMGLQVSDFSTGFTVVTIRRTVTEISRKDTGAPTPYMVKERPKSGKSRAVTLGVEAAAMIAELVRDRGLYPGDRLFSMLDRHGKPVRTPEWPGGLPVGRSYFRERIWRPANARAGVKARRFHDLRGCHISWMLAGGADVVTVMTLAGHRNLSTTQMYISAMGDAGARGRLALEATRRLARRHVESDARTDRP
ncbi:MAG: tyrosine-type recombinase/integrase, partial [Nocardioides sp.]|nr:tyrosine-type recombinase/integrase [Nocardioides sp.]